MAKAELSIKHKIHLTYYQDFDAYSSKRVSCLTACLPACQVPTSVVVTLAYNVPKFFELRIEDGDVITTDMRNNALYSSLYVFWDAIQ